MTSHISKVIVEYIGDYDMSECRKKNREGDLHSERAKIAALLRRVALEKEVGSYSIQQKDALGRVTSKEFTVIVTRHIGAWEKQLFTAWLDEGELTSCLGTMRIDLYRTQDNGAVCSSSNPDGISELSFIYNYASEAAGCVFIENLDAPERAKFRGIGSGLIQVAAEVSLDAGCDGRLLLTATKDSPGFYKKVHFTTGNKQVDSGIDIPGYGVGIMKLELEARLAYREIIARKPILRGAGAGAAAAKEESKSSKN